MGEVELMKDRYGKKVKVGDQLESAYGIPGRKIIGTVTLIDGKLWVLTPGHNPDKCKLTAFKRYFEFEIVDEPCSDCGGQGWWEDIEYNRHNCRCKEGQ